MGIPSARWGLQAAQVTSPRLTQPPARALHRLQHPSRPRPPHNALPSPSLPGHHPLLWKARQSPTGLAGSPFQGELGPRPEAPAPDHIAGLPLPQCPQVLPSGCCPHSCRLSAASDPRTDCSRGHSWARVPTGRSGKPHGTSLPSLPFSVSSLPSLWAQNLASPTPPPAARTSGILCNTIPASSRVCRVPPTWEGGRLVPAVTCASLGPRWVTADKAGPAPSSLSPEQVPLGASLLYSSPLTTWPPGLTPHTSLPATSVGPRQLPGCTLGRTLPFCRDGVLELLEP